MTNPNDIIVVNDDGGWCWFESPGSVIDGDQMVIGSVASGYRDKSRVGNIELLLYNFTTKVSKVVKLYNNLELDDHDGPAIFKRTDNRCIAMFSKHSMENHCYYKISDTNNPEKWGSLLSYTPSEATELTYSNLYSLPEEGGRIYNFYRGLDNSYKPSYAFSDNLGETWNSGNVYIQVPSIQRHRPYVRYASNYKNTIHMLYTEAHPRDFDNSLYHIYYTKGNLFNSNGNVIRSLEKGLLSPDEGTRIYAGGPDNVAWTVDLVLDHVGNPVVIYSVQLNSAGLPVGKGGDDIRYRYARWDGNEWKNYPLAFAGCRLYSGEDDYSGLAAVEPNDISVVYISTNSHPISGEPLISRTDGKRHFEIFKGKTVNSGESWNWLHITKDSSADNLRPMRPRSNSNHNALVWLRGSYTAYTEYQQEVVALML